MSKTCVVFSYSSNQVCSEQAWGHSTDVNGNAVSRGLDGYGHKTLEEQRCRRYLMHTTTEELEKVRAQMRGMEKELTKAKENAANMATTG